MFGGEKNLQYEGLVSRLRVRRCYWFHDVFIYKSKRVRLVSLICCCWLAVASMAQTKAPVVGQNLVENGNFEFMNYGFTSEYRFEEQTSPGAYVVTSNAPMHNPDFANPIHGDHTKGVGRFLIANADGTEGKKIWCSEITVIPNSMYEFSGYFCNLFARLPAKTNFAIDEGDVKGNDPEIKVTMGADVIAMDKDFYHLFRWIRVSGVWYSGTHNGKVDLCIENTNTSVFGNDMAIDDISFSYIKTMPEGYQPPQRTVTVVDRYYVPPDTSDQKVPLSAYGEFELNDEVTEGVYVMHPKPWHPIQVESNRAEEDSIIERIAMHNLIFDQTKSDLKPSAKEALDLVAQWMKRDTTVRVRFLGHTDNQGDPALNVKLSEERVGRVKQYLVDKGIAPERIETIGYGGMYPIADNSHEESRKLNRRVEMEILR